jgi:hypothetical protein
VIKKKEHGRAVPFNYGMVLAGELVLCPRRMLLRIPCAVPRMRSPGTSIGLPDFPRFPFWFRPGQPKVNRKFTTVLKGAAAENRAERGSHIFIKL